MGLLAGIAIVLGIICFLLMEHPIMFWCLFLPIALGATIGVVQWLRK